jgi:predicted cupin superfamily sugar epimerase
LLFEISGSMSMTRFELDVRCSTFDVQTPMTNDLSAEEVRALLKLEPHATCGYVRVTFISNQRIAPGGLPAPFLDGRPAGSALYFMVTPDAPVRLHRIRNESALSPLFG